MDKTGEPNRFSFKNRHYLEKLRDEAQKLYEQETQDLHRTADTLLVLPGDTTTFDALSFIEGEIGRRERLEKKYAPVSIESCELERALSPIASFTTILQRAGKSDCEIEAGDVGDVLGALLFNAYKKTGGYPSIGEAM